MSDWTEVHNPPVHMLTITEEQVQKPYVASKIKNYESRSLR